jgi:uncharacterized RDD family membrane protein YckC
MATSTSGASAAARTDFGLAGRRALAIIADGLLLGVAFSAISLVLRAAQAGDLDASLPLGYAWGGGFFLLAMTYYSLMEGYRGRTVGKMLLGIRVVREDTGGVPGVKKAAIRSLLRVVDGIFGYLVGFIAVVVSGKDQRLGDMLARTVVVRER